LIYLIIKLNFESQWRYINILLLGQDYPTFNQNCSVIFYSNN